MELIFIFTLIYILTLLVFGVVGWILYLIYRPFEKRLLKAKHLQLSRSRQIRKLWLLLILTGSAYIAYDAVFPGKSFYSEEFRTVTLRPLPESAKFISKAASFPDFHGDYCSSAQIKLSKTDYQSLLKEIRQDNRLTSNAQLIGSDQFRSTLGSNSEDEIIYSFERKIPDEEDHYLFIGFCRDGQTVFVNVCVS